MSNRQIKRAIAVACAILATGCATNPNGQPVGFGEQLKQTFASDDPCANNARNIGMLGGAVAGTILAKTLGGSNAQSLATGALLGGLLGGMIGADMDRKRCELSKVAKQYDLDIHFSPIDANGDVMDANSVASSNTNRSDSKQSAVGSTLTIRDKGGAAGHFQSGSDQLTPKAKEYFAAIASHYTAEKMLAGETDARRRDEIGKQITARRLFLIGHTDDTGSSQLNASLSERRAKAVANFLKQQGIKEDSLYFQGAGETIPLADNRTDAGRAENRRVEILEIADESSFNKYLATRKPNYQFYRPKEASSPTLASAPGGMETGGASPAATTSKSSASRATKPAPNLAKTQSENKKLVAAAPARQSPTVKTPAVNFGGAPYSPAEATLNVGSLTPTKTGFSLISKAYANDTSVLADCSHDRARTTGSVKSLKSGAAYKTNEHIAQLYGKTWAGDVNGNLIVINRLAVLRDAGAPANLPELKVYAQYKPGSTKKPDIHEEPLVNSYLVGEGVLYRMFTPKTENLECVDVLFATDGSTSAKGGKIVYGTPTARYVANFKPQVQ